ncbi:eukaryotic translation elongation factor 1 epsilon-1-like [Halichondria panicea]|uniref:eukaryotic translation elongation factor 1 epsilon-1-like n=1 Tax=Halichondria panicea TaxID=6063 RepID=UPI00312B705E
MAEDSVPWEVRLLQAYCKNDDSLESLGYAKQSVLAGAWYVACGSHGSLPADVCLCGVGRVEEGLIRQWVEYYLSQVRTETVWDALSKDQQKAVLKEVNGHLSSCIFMVGYKVTLADIVLYYGLHRYLGGMSFIQKAQYPHVCRWFDQVQHFPDVRPFSLPLIVFHKNPQLLTSSVGL